MENLKRLTIRASAKLSTSIQFMRETPIEDFLEIVEEIARMNRGE